MKKLLGVSIAFGALMATLVMWGGAAAATSSGKTGALAQVSGAREFGDEILGSNITECPQAGLNNQSLRRTEPDAVEERSDRGDDIRLNQDYACMPQDEMSIAVNPTDTDNVFGSANDYRLGWGSSGFYVTTDSFREHGGGNDHGPGHGHGNEGSGSHYDGITIAPTPGSYPTPAAPKDHIDGGGDPIAIYDREGTAYYGQIRFERENDTGGIFVNRSTNGGFTWSRPCIPNAGGVCGGNGDPRQPGDGVTTWNPDNDGILNGSVPFDDKPYGTAGPRPAGVAAQCFTPAHTPTPCPEGHVGPDRIYITWTRFFSGTSQIMISFSDDRARSWSLAKVINGSAPFCVGGACSSNQGSQPVVNPTNGALYVMWENFNTPDENQNLLVRSTDGSATFAGPFFITPVFDVNYPQGNRNRQDCVARGQGSTRPVLTNSCARVNARGAIAVDKRGGAFADDLYVVIADNRNGTIASSNTDVLLFKSTNGGTVWTGPTRVNNDPSTSPANRNCGLGGRPPCPAGVNTGNDQWYPWLDISGRGWLHGAWQDRRLDTTSPIGVGEWPTSKTRVGNYLAWYWGGRCRVTTTGPVDQSSGRQCVHPGAAIITQPQGPVNPPDDYLDPAQSVFPWRNFGISDTPYNWDYCFRAGIFCGDYENVTIDVDNNVWAMWTDARNGRSSRTQTGRNPACEQSDAWADTYRDNKDAKGQQTARSSDSLYYVTPCPIQEED